jgi:hypothetical protein
MLSSCDKGITEFMRMLETFSSKVTLCGPVNEVSMSVAAIFGIMDSDTGSARAGRFEGEGKLTDGVASPYPLFVLVMLFNSE